MKTCKLKEVRQVKVSNRQRARKATNKPKVRLELSKLKVVRLALRSKQRAKLEKSKPKVKQALSKF